MIGLYVHIPFCLTKCPYCDFYSERYSKSLAESYKKAVIRNIKHYNESYDTVYFGGGTPILMAEEIGDIIAAANVSEKAEITVEANPCISDKKHLEALLKAGVNRISFGVQSMNDNELRFLGRHHTAEQAKGAVSLAHSLGFKNISADLMMGLPNQTMEDILNSINGLSELPITHISSYLLKIEDGTPFSEMSLDMPEDERTAEMYIYACDMLNEKGFFQYEISNFSKSGYECEHNLKYWRCQEYLGIGAAAHSYYKNQRFCTARSITDFISAEHQQIEITDEICGDFDEYAMLKLRLREGLSFGECDKFGVDKKIILRRLEKIPKEYFNLSEQGISLTKQGFLLSNAVIGTILGY